MAKAPEAVIRLYFCDPCILTTQQYEQVKKDVQARAIAGDSEVGDRVLAKLLYEHHGRYVEAKEINLHRRGKQIATRAPRLKHCRCYRCHKLFPIRSMHLVLLDGTQWSCDNCWDERLRS